MKQTQLKFLWWETETNVITLELDCTIPLNVGDVMIYPLNGVNYHLEVERRNYIPSINTLSIIFKTQNIL